MVEHLFSEACQDEQRREFAERYESIMTKPLSKNWVTKERGYTNLNRFADQRLFNQLYPVLERHRESSFGVQMIL